MPGALGAVDVFLSYSHRDEDLRGELVNHLASLKRQGIVSVWHDRKIGAGREWADEIDEHLDTASVILLLISSDFLSSDYCYDVEMRRAMERHGSHEARVIPIILRPVDWSGAPFAGLQALPRDARAVTTWPNRDEAFASVAQGIRAAVEDLLTEQLSALFEKFSRAQALENWPNVISLGERILRILPGHDVTRRATAAAYVEKSSKRVADDRYPITASNLVSVRTKRSEDLGGVLNGILADLDQAIRLDPDAADHHYLRFAVRYHGLGHAPGAEEAPYQQLEELARRDLERAIELGPDSGKYFYARALIHAQRGDLDAARADLKRAGDLGCQPDPYVVQRIYEPQRRR